MKVGLVRGESTKSQEGRAGTKKNAEEKKRAVGYFAITSS